MVAVAITNKEAIAFVYAGYNNQKFFDAYNSIQNVDYLIKQYDDHILLVFPGSRSILSKAGLIDWALDFRFIMVNDPDLGQVEAGFNTGSLEVCDKLEPLLKGANKPVYICAHSLGVPRALIFAARLLLRGFDPNMITIVGFAPPKPGGQKLVDILEPVNDIRLLCLNNDEVCSLPPTIPDLPYMHVRVLIHENIVLPAGDIPHHDVNYAAAEVFKEQGIV